MQLPKQWVGNSGSLLGENYSCLYLAWSVWRLCNYQNRKKG